MRKLVMSTLAAMVLLGLVGQAFSNGQTGVSIAPQTLLLSSSQSGWVTVHTNIPWAGQESVLLEGISASAVFADSRGDLVAKFSEDAVKAIVAPPSAVLTLTIDGIDVGSDEVRVME